MKSSFLVCLPVILAVSASAAPVRVDQVGYLPGDAKWVAVSVPAAGFEVVRVTDDQPVFSGSLFLRRAADPASGDDVYEGDFSPVIAPGRYRIRVAGTRDSPPFFIQPAVYDDLYRNLVKGLHYQRCGTAIPSEVGGAWTHEPCHDHGASIAAHDWASTGGTPTGYRNTIGGWHDAGDYGKYSTNNAYTIGVLLQAYELAPGRYAHDDCGIPESGNGVPDLLDEARWSLQWMLAMQDPDGGVRHRESAATYIGDHVPEDDPAVRYYTSVSSDATAAQAAAMALAARVYGPVDAGFAAACSVSSVSAWTWLGTHPDRVPAGGFQNLYGHTGATYAGSSDLSHRLWAVAEIFRLTGDPAARSWFDAHWGDGKTFNGVWYPDSWGDLANLAAFTYRDTPGATPDVVSGSWWSVENSTSSSAGVWNTRANQDGYGCLARTDDYYWGFTGVALRYAWTMIQADRYSADPAAVQAAREQLHYILGRNPLGKVYLTGIGADPVLHSHGAWNLAGGFTAVEDSLCNPIPYQLVGGPNAADNGDLSPHPGRCYEDIADPDYYYKGNYTLNETSINIQASMIVLAGWFGTGGTATGIADREPAPGPAPVLSAFPNPFRFATRLGWELPGPAGPVTVEILDLAGRAVRLLPVSTGARRVGWDGRDARGWAVPSGVYYARIRGEGGPLKIVRLR